MLVSDVKWNFHHNYDVQYRGASNKMDDDIDDPSSDFLPDLINEKTSEQLLFDSKVYHANKQFVRIRADIKKWILSQVCFWQTVLQYSYDGKNCSKGIFVMIRWVSK